MQLCKAFLKVWDANKHPPRELFIHNNNNPLQQLGNKSVHPPTLFPYSLLHFVTPNCQRTCAGFHYRAAVASSHKINQIKMETEIFSAENPHICLETNEQKAEWRNCLYCLREVRKESSISIWRGERSEENKENQIYKIKQEVRKISKKNKNWSFKMI